MFVAAPLIGPKANCASIRAPPKNTGIGTPGTLLVTKSMPRNSDPNTPVVYAVIEVLGYEPNTYIYGALIKHKWGRTVLFDDKSQVLISYVKMKSMSAQFVERQPQNL